jgi:hypothetical protein
VMSPHSIVRSMILTYSFLGTVRIIWIDWNEDDRVCRFIVEFVGTRCWLVIIRSRTMRVEQQSKDHIRHTGPKMIAKRRFVKVRTVGDGVLQKVLQLCSGVPRDAAAGFEVKKMQHCYSSAGDRLSSIICAVELWESILNILVQWS